MNSFGRIFRVSIFGESHGESVGILIDGCPAGLDLSADDLLPDLERRKGGSQKGTTPRKEDDFPIFKSGIFNDKTTGAPILIYFENKNTRSGDYEKQRAIPRPGHADFVARQKFGGFEDYRGSGHFSGRLTVALVAAGAIAKKLINMSSGNSSNQDVYSSLEENTSPPTPIQRRGEQGVSLNDVPGYFTNTPEQWEYLKVFAQDNRKSSTEAESLLWENLRNRKISNCKFRRQHPIHGFIPDFVCLEKKLVIEVDGQYHNLEEQKKYDEIRSVWLNAAGYDFLRFKNDEVLEDVKKVVSIIESKLNTITTPSPSERGTGGEVIKMQATLNEKISINSTILEIGGYSDLEEGLQYAIDKKDSIGGIIECRVTGLPNSLGEPFFDSVESVLSHAVFSIPAVRGIEFGTGFAAAKMLGSEHNDAIDDMQGHTRTNHAGGIVGGLTNGNELVFRIAIKPTSSTPKEQTTLNWETEKIETVSVKGRHDLCIALRVPVILEAVTAIVIADLLMMEQRIARIISK